MKKKQCESNGEFLNVIMALLIIGFFGFISIELLIKVVNKF